MAAGKYLELAVILKAVDQMSGTVRSALGGATGAYRTLANSQERAQENMRMGLNLGAGAFLAMDALKNLADKYGDVDAAQRQLRISEMKPGGMIDGPAFEKEMKLVKALSGVYGEHQSAYVNMIRVMRNYHLDDSDILGGTGNQVALLSKLFNSTPDAGALFASRMKTDFRVLPSEMSKMIDMAVRLKQLNSGLSGEEMLHNLTEFSAGIALSSQNLGMHGAKDASELQILGAMYTSKGIDAPQVATTLRRIFENITKPERLKKMDEAAAKYGKHLHFFDGKGNFEGIDNFVAQLGTLKNLKPSAVTEILGVLGSAQGMSSVMLKNISKFGTDDFLEFKRNYADQGTPQQKLEEMMGGQTEQLKKATIDLENLEIELGKKYNPAVKEGAKLSQGFFKLLADFAENHGIITGVAGGLTAIAVGGMFVGSAFHFMKAAWAYSGMARVFTWIAGTEIWAGLTAGAEGFTYALLHGIGPALTFVGEGLVGLLSSAAGLAALAASPLLLGLYEANYGSASKILDQISKYEKGYTPVSDDIKEEFKHSDLINKGKKPVVIKDYGFKDIGKDVHLLRDHPDITRQIRDELRRNQPSSPKPTLVYSPTININGNTPVSKKDMSSVLDDHGSKLMELIRKQNQDKLRTQFH